MRIFFTSLLFLAVMLIAVPEVFAQVVNNAWGIPGLNLPFQSQLEMRLCLLRRVFCDTFVLMAITISIFLIGIMVLNYKITWQTGMILISGIVIFSQAPSIAAYFSKKNSIVFMANPICDCRCKISSLPWPFSGMNFGLLGSFLTQSNQCISTMTQGAGCGGPGQLACI